LPISFGSSANVLSCDSASPSAPIACV